MKMIQYCPLVIGHDPMTGTRSQKVLGALLAESSLPTQRQWLLSTLIRLQGR